MLERKGGRYLSMCLDMCVVLIEGRHRMYLLLYTGATLAFPEVPEMQSVICTTEKDNRGSGRLERNETRCRAMCIAALGKRLEH